MIPHSNLSAALSGQRKSPNTTRLPSHSQQQNNSVEIDFAQLAVSKEPLRWNPNASAIQPRPAMPTSATQAEWVPSKSFQSKPSINSYQPSSSWIANGWGAVVPGSSVDDRQHLSFTADGRPRERHEDREWHIASNTNDEWASPQNPISTSLGQPQMLSPGNKRQPEWPVVAGSWNGGKPEHSDGRSFDAPADSEVKEQVEEPPFELIGNGRWKVSEKIGSGSFGQVFAAVDLETGVHVAIKRELTENRRAQLPHEYEVYQILRRLEGIPRIYFSGTEGPFNVLVMDRLGPSLKKLIQESPRNIIPLRTMVAMTPQLIRRLQSVHEAGIVFRDVKPDQFCIGKYNADIKDRPTAYLIDFGLATSYRDASLRHIKNVKPVKNSQKTGTARYASLNIHKGKLHSRRDDLESLGYMLLECVKGPLPWCGVRALTSVDGWRKIGIMKDDMTIPEMCEGIPWEFGALIEHARELRFADTPNYAALIRSFVDLLVKLDEESNLKGSRNRGLVWRVEEDCGSEW